MSLTPEEKQRIIEEEQLRAKIRKDLNKPSLSTQMAKTGVGLILLALTIPFFAVFFLILYSLTL